MLVIDNLYKYKIDEVLEGGMGRVFLLTQISAPKQDLAGEILLRNNEYVDLYKIPHRNKLAAKTVKQSLFMRDFERECLLWLEINEPGIVPLLKVTKINEIAYALMPRYSKSLRELLQKEHNKFSLMKLLYEPILGLAKTHSSKGIIHQDIKPENFLYQENESQKGLFLSDWGIANLQANLVSKAQLKSAQYTFQTMTGFGTLPYMAPERFLKYYSSISGDIFSLGIVFIEILTGALPYKLSEPIESQILNGNYFHDSKKILSIFGNKISKTILSMIHPYFEKRTNNYKEILKFIKAI